MTRAIPRARYWRDSRACRASPSRRPVKCAILLGRMKAVRAVRGSWFGRWARRAQCAALLLSCVGLARPALAEEQKARPKAAIGFSNLIARLENDEIGFAKPEFRVHILEALRDAGFNAVGAESLVFGKDDAERADLVLGGTVTELRCRSWSGQLRCLVGIEWQVLDRESDQIVYRVLSRYAGFD